MELLLDTNAVIWLAQDNPRLRNETRRRMSEAASVQVSLVSIWEIAIKISIGKLHLDIAELLEGLQREGISLLSLSTEHCLRFATLPLHHRDPYDRMLVAQALDGALTIVTADRRLAAYGVPILPCG